MSASEQYFAAPESGRQPTRPGRFLEPARDVPAVTFVDGLTFHPALGESVMVNMVHFAPHTEAPRHAHDEEQITIVVEGELEFELGDTVRLLRPGMLAVIPPNVPHAARTRDQPSLEYDVFCPPRQALLDLTAAPETTGPSR